MIDSHVRRWALTLGAAVAVVAACSLTGSAVAAPPQPGPSVLEVGKRPSSKTLLDLDVVARQVTLLHLSGRRYGIVMTGVSPKLVAMSQAPRRFAAYPPMEVLGFWSRMFPKGPPNALVMGRYDSATDAPVVITMARPTYDAATRTLSFKGTLLPGSARPPATMDDVDLMIDPTTAQWITLAEYCGPAIVNIVLAAIAEGANPYADVAAVSTSVGCIVQVVRIFGK